MTGRDAFDDLADAFGDDLRRAEARQRAARPGRRRRLVAAGAGLAVAGTAAALAIGIGAGPKLDVVAEARAALEPTGSILHVRYVSGSPDALHDSTVGDTWAASDPLRWRFRQQTPFYDRSGGEARKTDGFQVDEYTYADGVMGLYSPRQKTLDLTAGYRDRDARIGLPPVFPFAPAGEDPIASIRGLLASGRLRDAGPGEVEGRPVRRLRGSLRDRQSGVMMPTEYDVDASSFVPVRVRYRVDEGAFSTVWFQAFERLPETPENRARLLSDVAPGTKVTRWHLPVAGQSCHIPKYERRCLD